MIKETKKEENKRNKEIKHLLKLREKEEKLTHKILQVQESPENYLDPPAKVEKLNLELQEIQAEIEKERMRSTAATSTWVDDLPNKGNENSTNSAGNFAIETFSNRDSELK